MPEDVDDVDRLEELAGERWGERWVIETKRFADGDRQAIAYHSRGVVDTDEYDEKLVEFERLQLGDAGEVGYDRVWLRQETIVDVREQETLDG